MTRDRLPNRRSSLTLEFVQGIIRYTTSGGFDEAGHLREVFLSGGKVGGDTQAAMRDAAIAASLALQFGCPVATLREALTADDDGQPSGPLGAALARLAPVEEVSDATES